ncbi:MAG: ATP-binding protein [Nitrospira sp.]|nr:ATP-binding protein [Nitrospira sp.]
MATKNPQEQVSAMVQSETTDGSVSAEVPQADPLDIIDLPSGKPLNDSAATALSKSRAVKWVVIAGPVGAGKTTLLATLYELFQSGPINGCRFAGSNTLPAFEEICHLSRMESGNMNPETGRTLYKEGNPSYLHLRLNLDIAAGKFTDLLFTDVSGEMFEDIRDSEKSSKDLVFLRRANYFLLLLDGKKCMRPDQRHKVVQDGKTILQACFDGEMLSKECVVKVVWSKFDYFRNAGDTQEHKKFRQETDARFSAAFSSKTKDLRFGCLASRPTEFDLEFGHGVNDLLAEWVGLGAQSDAMSLAPQIRGKREIELFARRMQE